MRQLIIILVTANLLASCGKEVTAPPRTKDGAPPSPSSSGADHHGAIVALGSVTLAGESFAIARHGECVPGKEGAFVVSRLGSGRSTGLFLWVEDASGAQVSAPAQGDPTGGDWHFHITPRGDSPAPSRVLLRLREGDRDERAALALHAGAAPTHDGIAVPILDAANTPIGWVELKLHHDKGDLELWLTSDGAMREPLDLPVDATIKASFPSHGDRTVELRVRNPTKNEDEEGRPNIRSGRTHYFIYPGDTGADDSWLQGKSFKAPVTLTIPMDGKTLTAGPFVLSPHGDGDHKH